MSRIGKTALGLAVALAGVVGPAGAADAAGTAACDVAYEPSAHTGGFTASITVWNSGDLTIDGWTLSFPLDTTARVVEFWNADVLTTKGKISAKDKGWNAKVEPQGHINVGFKAKGTSAAPKTVYVNGIACQPRATSTRG